MNPKFYILLQKRPEIILETLKNINQNLKESSFLKILENKRPESFLTALLKKEPEKCYDFNLSIESIQSSDEQPKVPTFQFGTPVDIAILYSLFHWAEFPSNPKYKKIFKKFTPKSKIRFHMLENLCKDIYINNKVNLISNDPFMFGIEQAYIPRFFYEDLMAIYYFFVVYLIEKHFQKTPSTKSNT